MFSGFKEMSLLHLEAAANSLWKHGPLDNLDKTMHDIWHRIIEDALRICRVTKYNNCTRKYDIKQENGLPTSDSQHSFRGDLNNNCRAAQSSDDLLPEYFQFTSTTHPDLLNEPLEPPKEYSGNVNTTSQPDNESENGGRLLGGAIRSDETPTSITKVSQDDIEFLFLAGYSPSNNCKIVTSTKDNIACNHNSPRISQEAQHTVGHEREEARRNTTLYDNPFDPRLTHDKPDVLSCLAHARKVALRNACLDVAERISDIMEAAMMRYRALLQDMSVSEQSDMVEQLLMEHAVRKEQEAAVRNARIPIILEDKSGNYCCIVENTMSDQLKRFWAVHIPHSSIESQPNLSHEIHKPLFESWPFQRETSKCAPVFNTTDFQPKSPQGRESKIGSPSRWLQPEDLEFLLNLIDSQRKASVSQQHVQKDTNRTDLSHEPNTSTQNNETTSVTPNDNVKRKLNYEENNLNLNLNNNNNTENGHEREDLNVMRESAKSPSKSKGVGFTEFLEKVLAKQKTPPADPTRRSRLETYLGCDKSDSPSKDEHEIGDMKTCSTLDANGQTTLIKQTHNNDAGCNILLAQGDGNVFKHRRVPQQIYNELLANETNTNKGNLDGNVSVHKVQNNKETEGTKNSNATEWRLRKIQEIVSRISKERSQTGPQPIEFLRQARNVPDFVIKEQREIAKSEQRGSRIMPRISKRLKKDKIRESCEKMRTSSNSPKTKKIHQHKARNLSYLEENMSNGSQRKPVVTGLTCRQKIETEIQLSYEDGGKHRSVQKELSCLIRDTKAIRITDPKTMQDIALRSLDETKNNNLDLMADYKSGSGHTTSPVKWSTTSDDLQHVVTLKQVMALESECQLKTPTKAVGNSTLNDIPEFPGSYQAMQRAKKQRTEENEARESFRRVNDIPEFVPRQGQVECTEIRGETFFRKTESAVTTDGFFSEFTPKEPFNQERNSHFETPLKANRSQWPFESTPKNRTSFASPNKGKSPQGPSIMRHVMTFMGHKSKPSNEPIVTPTKEHYPTESIENREMTPEPKGCREMGRTDVTIQLQGEGAQAAFSFNREHPNTANWMLNEPNHRNSFQVDAVNNVQIQPSPRKITTIPPPPGFSGPSVSQLKAQGSDFRHKITNEPQRQDHNQVSLYKGNKPGVYNHMSNGKPTHLSTNYAYSQHQSNTCMPHYRPAAYISLAQPPPPYLAQPSYTNTMRAPTPLVAPPQATPRIQLCQFPPQRVPPPSQQQQGQFVVQGQMLQRPPLPPPPPPPRVTPAPVWPVPAAPAYAGGAGGYMMYHSGQHHQHHVPAYIPSTTMQLSSSAAPNTYAAAAAYRPASVPQPVYFVPTHRI